MISGTGNLKLISNPEIKFPDDFEVYDPKVDNQVRLTKEGLTGNKVIEYLAILDMPEHIKFRVYLLVISISVPNLIKL